MINSVIAVVFIRVYIKITLKYAINLYIMQNITEGLRDYYNFPFFSFFQRL
jgi:hypothetical protein